jgi:hypothetical protein
MSSSVAAAKPVQDDALTICAISVLAGMLSDVLHEAVGHALLALLTGAQTGVVSTVAWSSAFDSRLVAAGGTLVNLAAGALLWIALRTAKNASMNARLFLLFSCAFNLFTGTGYFFFSGVTNFGDWAAVIAGVQPHWLWQTLLVVVGIAAYYGAALLVGRGIVRYVGVPRDAHDRLRRFLFLPYFAAMALAAAGGVLNPVGIRLLWQSALPATAGANSGLLWLRYYIPPDTAPERPLRYLHRNYVWVTIAIVCSLLFVGVLGRGITLHR